MWIYAQLSHIGSLLRPLFLLDGTVRNTVTHLFFLTGQSEITHFFFLTRQSEIKILFLRDETVRNKNTFSDSNRFSSTSSRRPSTSLFDYDDSDDDIAMTTMTKNDRTMTMTMMTLRR